VERDRIKALLAEARTGSSGILVVHGEAGVGKTALLEHARDRAGDMRQLRMSGVESEVDLAFAGLTELLLPVMDQLDELPEVQADALRCALAVKAEPANRLAARVGLVSLLAVLAEATPVLVTVDDAQWVDESSMAALVFAVRRLAAEPVVLLVASRRDDLLAAGLDRDTHLALDGLSDDEARQLLAESSQLRGAEAEQLLHVAAGNPLALLELPEMTEAGASPASDIVGPPPVGPRVHQAFRDRLDRLPASSRLAVGIVAADGTATVGEVLRAFDAVSLRRSALLPAERDGLVAIHDDRITLRHPLLRSVAYHSLPSPDRRLAHAAFARTLDPVRQVERLTWHRAAATIGTDEDVALALDEVARAAERRGALATTARGFARAATLSPCDDGRARRLHASAEAWEVGGYWQRSLDLLDEALAHAVDPALRAELAASMGKLEVYRSGPEKGSAILVAAGVAIEADDPERAARLFAYAVNAAVFAADVDGAVALAGRAVACGERAGGLSVFTGTIARVEAGLLAGDPSVAAAIEPLAQLAEGLMDGDLVEAEHVFSLVVLAEFVLESWDRAERLLDVMVRRALRTGRQFLLAFALVIRSEIEFRRGRWSAAYATVTTDVWDTLDLPGIGPWLYAIQARIEAGLGIADAEAHGTAALVAATETGTHAVAAWARASLGFLELGRGHPQAAVEHLEAVADRLDRASFVEPGILWWPADLIEAYWRVGDLGAARRQLEHLQARADATGRLWAQAAACRGAGLLASTATEMEACFASALRWHDQLDAPFERARTLLCLGERRLGLGDERAHSPVREALRAFEQLGAEPWVATARRLLGTDHTASAQIRLTRRERHIAAVVGRGATNREAAEELFLSVRTIDFHLRNIYKKLQVRSRTELAVRMASEGGTGAGGQAKSR